MERACHFSELYIDRYGSVFPCCKTYRAPKIGHIADRNIIDLINGFPQQETECRCHNFSLIKRSGLSEFQVVTAELSAICHALCSYCFQRDGKAAAPYLFFDELYAFLTHIHADIFQIAGGEILDQKDSMAFIEKLRDSIRETWFHLKTNGNADSGSVEYVKKCFDSAVVSFNGFSKETVKTIMQVDLEKTKRFCESLSAHSNVKLGLKFLNSPLVIADIAGFLNWSLSEKANPQSVIFQTANIYENDFAADGWAGSTFEKLNLAYWQPLFDRVSRDINAIILENEKRIKKGIQLSADKNFLKIFKLDGKVKEIFETDGIYRLRG